MLKNFLCEILIAFLDFSYHDIWRGLSPPRGKLGAGIPVTSRGKTGRSVSEAPVHSSSTSWEMLRCNRGEQLLPRLTVLIQMTVRMSHNWLHSLIHQPVYGGLFAEIEIRILLVKPHILLYTQDKKKVVLSKTGIFPFSFFFLSYPFFSLMSPAIKIAN